MFNFFLNLPIWAVFTLTCLAIYAAFQGGIFLGRKHRQSYEKEDRSPVGSIVGAALGLLAFLLAFTFGIAAAKFEERRSLVLEEANAIGTTYLRSEYLPDDKKEEIQNLLKKYVINRLDTIRLGNLEEGLKNSDILQNLLWKQAVDVAKSKPDSDMFGLFIQSLNEVIDLHAKRVNVGIHIRLPAIIWIALYFITILAMGSLGYQIGLTNSTFMGIVLLLAFTFSSVITLIADLDRPQEGLIQVSQKPLRDLLDKMNS